MNAEATIRLPDGGSLCAYTNETDEEVRRVGILYRGKDGYGIDLALAEVKRGEIASAVGLKKDNDDIDVYLWADPSTDNFTLNCHISHDDIIKAIKEE